MKLKEIFIDVLKGIGWLLLLLTAIPFVVLSGSVLIFEIILNLPSGIFSGRFWNAIERFDIYLQETESGSNKYNIVMIPNIDTNTYSLTLGTSQKNESCFFTKFKSNTLLEVEGLEEAERVALIHYRLFNTPVGHSMYSLNQCPAYKIKFS